MSISDAFLKLITERTEFSSDWSIEWQDLLTFDSSLAHRVKVQPLNQRDVRSFGNFQGWGAPTEEVQVGQMLLNLVPALMARYACGMLSFTLTNHTATGFPVAVVTAAMGLTPAINLEGQYHSIEYDLQTQIMPQLTKAGNMMLDITGATVSLLTDSYFTISVNHGKPTPLTAPTYADSLFSPVLSQSDQALGQIAFDLGMLGGQLANNAPRPPVSLNMALENSYQNHNQNQPIATPGSFDLKSTF